MISYDRFWRLLAKSGLSQYQLLKTRSISAHRLNALRHNRYVRVSLIASLCALLDCAPSDLMEEDARPYNVPAHTPTRRHRACQSPASPAHVLCYAPLFSLLAKQGYLPNDLVKCGIITSGTLRRLMRGGDVSLYTLEQIGIFLQMPAASLFFADASDESKAIRCLGSGNPNVRETLL